MTYPKGEPIIFHRYVKNLKPVCSRAGEGENDITSGHIGGSNEKPSTTNSHWRSSNVRNAHITQTSRCRSSGPHLTTLTPPKKKGGVNLYCIVIFVRSGSPVVSPSGNT